MSARLRPAAGRAVYYAQNGTERDAIIEQDRAEVRRAALEEARKAVCPHGGCIPPPDECISCRAIRAIMSETPRAEVPAEVCAGCGVAWAPGTHSCEGNAPREKTSTGREWNMTRGRLPKCDRCGHVRARHIDGAGTCYAKRSCGPSGVYRCPCAGYVPGHFEQAASDNPANRQRAAPPAPGTTPKGGGRGSVVCCHGCDLPLCADEVYCDDCADDLREDERSQDGDDRG